MCAEASHLATQFRCVAYAQAASAAIDRSRRRPTEAQAPGTTTGCTAELCGQIRVLRPSPFDLTEVLRSR